MAKKHTKRKSKFKSKKHKATVNGKNCSYVYALSLCTTVVHNTALNSLIIFRLFLWIIMIAQMLSTEGRRWIYLNRIIYNLILYV